MTQQEKAAKVLERIFLNTRYHRIGVSEKFLRETASKHWVGEGAALSATTLLNEAERQFQNGRLIKFKRAQTWYYAPAKRKQQ